MPDDKKKKSSIKPNWVYQKGQNSGMSQMLDEAAGISLEDRGRMNRPGAYERNPRTSDIQLGAEKPVMRAATPKERIGDFFSGLMESVSEQPLVRGLSKANELLNPAPPPGFKIGMMPGEPGSALGKALAPNVKMMHPSVPPEFHAVEPARMPQARTAPIDMNDLPSGKMDFLDPDVAEFMKPGVPDLATREGQERLKVLKYLTSRR